jgi:hypothetical protein
MGWVPSDAWLSKIAIDARASDLQLDLAIDASGAGMPSPMRAGVAGEFAAAFLSQNNQWLIVTAVAVFSVPFWTAFVLVLRRRPVPATLT